MLVFVLVLVCILAALLLAGMMIIGRKRMFFGYNFGKGALFVIAHPDDEVMFLTPTILSIPDTVRSQCAVLCMTASPSVRADELKKSCSALGISPSRVRVVNDPERFRDGLDAEWKLSEVANEIVSAAAEFETPILITFDEYGISEHQNHIDTCLGAQVALMSERKKPENTRVVKSLWAIVTYNFVLKYLASLNAIVEATKMIIKERTEKGVPKYVFASNPKFASTWKAMKNHKSQFVWYRKLWCLFSSYAYINTLRREA